MRHKGESEGRKTLVIRWMVIAALSVLAVVVLSLLAPTTTRNRQVVAPKEPVKLALADFKAPIEEPLDANSEISGEYRGLCKKNSIHSVADFQRTVRNDPVLSRHFSGFDWDAAKLGYQDKAIWTFVSYRRGDDINRTTRPVRLAKGDQYITDGSRTLRTFCCNDYVIAPPAAKEAAVESAAAERVDGPTPRTTGSTERVDGPSRRELTGVADENQPDAVPEALRSIPSSTIDLPKAFGGGGFSTLSSAKRLTPSESNPPVNPPTVPEPSTFFQVGAGIVFGLFLLRRNRAKRL
jgi:hypothetical protein